MTPNSSELQNSNISVEKTSSPSVQQKESFAEQQLQKINTIYPSLDLKKQEFLQKQLNTTNNLPPETQKDIVNLINQIIESKPINIIPIIKKMMDDINQKIIISSQLYQSNTEGFLKTEQDQTAQENNQTAQEKTKTSQEKTETSQEKTETSQKKTETKEDTKQLLQQIATNINNLSSKIDKIPYTNSDYRTLTANPQTNKVLEIFKKALGYDFTPGEGLTREELEKNGAITQRAIQYLKYNIENSKKVWKEKDNPNSKISEEEKQQAKQFRGYLKDSGIDPREFYRSLWKPGEVPAFDTDFKNREGRRPNFETNEKDISTDTLSSSTKSESTLAADMSVDFDKIDTGEMKIKNIFTDAATDRPKSGFNDAGLARSFPLPQGLEKKDFQYSEANAEHVLGKINAIMSGNIPYPLIDNSTSNPKMKQIAKKRLIMWFMMKQSPDLQKVPESVLNILFPDTKEKGDQSNRNKRGNFKEKIRNLSRDEIINKNEKDIVVPLMKNNFVNPKIEESFSKTIKKGYLSYMSELMKKTPGLEQFSYDPKNVKITNNKLELPLSINGKNQVDTRIIIENGTMYLTNQWYDSSDLNNQHTIKKGKVTIGQVKDFSTFSQDSASLLSPEFIAQSAQQSKPQEYYLQEFQNNIKNIPTTKSDDLTMIQAGIAHSLSQNKVQESVRELMLGWNNDGSDSLDSTTKNSPFYEEIQQYESASDKTITKESHHQTFDILNVMRNTMLQNSAQENIKLKDNIKKLQGLLHDPSFTMKINEYIKNHPSEDATPKQAILLTLNPQKRNGIQDESKESLHMFLKLFGTNIQPGQENNNTIRTESFNKVVENLANEGDLDTIDRNNIIPTNNPIIEDIHQKYQGTNADTELEKALSSI